MRILQLHTDFIEYEPIKKEIAQAEEAEKKKVKLEEILVLLTCVEEGDNEEVARKAIEETKEFLKKLKLNRILIYPFAHLSSSIAKPSDALRIIKEMEEYSKKSGIETFRAPFGWNKALQIKVKGHPLAEQSRHITAKEKEEKVSEALKVEEKIKSYWFILSPDGKLTEVEKFDFSNYPNLKKFADYEVSKVRASQQVPPHVILMKKLEIADYEEGSDPGNLRWYPKGRLIKSLLENFVTQKVLEYGGMEVETPIMYDFQHPALAKYLNRFPARQYVVKSEDKELFLRFSACFGQFLMSKDAQISYKNLPYKIYELTRYSFRREKSGEVVGLKRLRAFTMPDVHALCEDMKQAMEEFLIRFKLCMEILKEIGLEKEDYEFGIRVTKDFYEKNKKFILSLVKLFGKPALLEMWSERFFYFVLKWEFNFVDNLNKAAALSTDQIDVENAERYGITYIDKNGKKKYPIILHCSPSGAIERCIYALLEKAYSDQKNGKVPKLPLWLSPTQVRLIPVSNKFLEDVEKIAKVFEENCIRVDIDDREETVSKKIREAEIEWVPFICVVGSKEVKEKVLAVRIREKKEVKEMKIEDLIKRIKEEVKDKPFKILSLPKYLSKRAVFSS
ncbi:MAG: threonine--tRNA ligase [Candidatus Aenigmarchaeota archaeon]|nr:threonine--tRNA ligase [Candidatus Aenigmarchaeota archaeon]